MGIPRSVSYLRVFWSVACKKWMILQLLNKLSGKNEPRKLFPKTSFVRRIYNLIDSGWDIDGIFSFYTVWADIATGSVIYLWDPDFCYGLWADETTFAYDVSSLSPREFPPPPSDSVPDGDRKIVPKRESSPHQNFVKKPCPAGKIYPAATRMKAGSNPMCTTSTQSSNGSYIWKLHTINEKKE